MILVYIFKYLLFLGLISLSLPSYAWRNCSCKNKQLKISILPRVVIHGKVLLRTDQDDKVYHDTQVHDDKQDHMASHDGIQAHDMAP